MAFVVHNLWILLAATLVFVMHLGFACLEAGSVRQHSITNILFKNTAIIAIGLLSYAFVGFGLMYPGSEFAGTYFGFAGFGLDPGTDGLTPAYNPAYTYFSDFIFQAMFAATAATIVSGAVAERIRLSALLWFSVIFISTAYPIVGMWKWGGGFLDTLGFYDFAGSTIVHSVGGWAALAGAIVLGPRLGRFVRGREGEFAPSSTGLATIGAFLLWFGWYGFNGGSVLSAEPAALSLVFVTTSLAAAAGIAGSGMMNSMLRRENDLMMILNGSLAGLVSVTAGADVMNPMMAIVAGFVGGSLVVLSILALNKVRIDDPVGAISVHLTCGIWGTMAVGVMSTKASFAQFGSQMVGIATIGLFCFAFAFSVFKGLDFVLGLREEKSAQPGELWGGLAAPRVHR